MQRQDHVKRLQEDSSLQAKERGLRRRQVFWHPILDFLPSGVWWSEFLRATVSVIFCYSTPKQINIVLKRPCFFLPLICVSFALHVTSLIPLFISDWREGSCGCISSCPQRTQFNARHKVYGIWSLASLSTSRLQTKVGGHPAAIRQSASQTSSHGVNLVNHMSTFQKRPTWNSKRIRKCQTVSQAIGRSTILWNLHLFLHICK